MELTQPWPPSTAAKAQRTHRRRSLALLPVRWPVALLCCYLAAVACDSCRLGRGCLLQAHAAYTGQKGALPSACWRGGFNPCTLLLFRAGCRSSSGRIRRACAAAAAAGGAACCYCGAARRLL